MIFGDILKGVFGDKGLAGGVIDVLKSTGVIKDPAQLQAAQEALMKFELEQGAQEVKLEEIAAGDRKSARDMNIAALAQDDIFSKRFTSYLALTVLALLFVAEVVMAFVKIPTENIAAFKDFLRTLEILASAVVFFYFGSSRGSAAKDDIIARMGK